MKRSKKKLLRSGGLVADPLPPAPRTDPLYMKGMLEAANTMVARMAAENDWTLEQVQAFMQENFVGRPLDEALAEFELTPSEQAYQMIARAHSAETPNERKMYAEHALALDAKNIDAQLILAEYLTSGRERVKTLRKIIRKAEDNWGPEFFEVNRGQFWLIQETRPYMRTCAQLANELADTGDVAGAILEVEKLLELSPNDNLGMRDYLIGWYLAERNPAKARQLIDVRYKGDPSACFQWGRAIAYYMLGDEHGAKKALKKAIRENYHVVLVLIGESDFVDASTYAPGSVEEASYVVECLQPALLENKKMVQWLVFESVQIMK